MRIWKAAAILIAIVCAGCGTTTTKYPVGTTTGLQPDRMLTGTWIPRDDKTGGTERTEDGKTAGYIHIIPTGDTFDILMVSLPTKPDGNGEWEAYHATAARLGDNRYLNISVLPPPGEKLDKPLLSGTLPYFYRFEASGELTVFRLNQEKVIAAINTGALTGTVEKHTYKYEGKEYGDSKDVQITSDPPALDAYFAKPEATALFEPMGVLKRAD